MKDYKYENHIMPEPKLPFIFHPRYTQRKRSSLANWHVNIEILHCIEGSGFVRCGIIYLEDGDPRIAFQKE